MESILQKQGCLLCKLREGYLSVRPYVDNTIAFEDFAVKENIRDIASDNLAFCMRCHIFTCAPKCGKSEDEFFGVKKTSSGKEFDNTCCGGGDTHFNDPGEAEIDCIKKLIEFKRQIIDGIRLFYMNA